MLVYVLMGIILTGCVFNINGVNNISPSDQLLTSSVKTVSVQLSETAARTQQSLTPAITDIILKESKTVALESPSATPGNQSTQIVTLAPCYLADFVSDVTIPDGAEVNAGESFNKVWRLVNLGSCKWKSDFTVVFIQGTQMGSSEIYNFTNVDIESGQTADISIDLSAPLEPGVYTAEYLLKSSDGTIFGLGTTGKGTFYVKITVPSPTSTNSPTYTMVVETSTPTAPVSETETPIISQTVSP
jgi:hypothetical protein